MLPESMISPYDRNNYRKWKQWDRVYNMKEMWPEDRYPEAVSPWMYYTGCFVTSLAIMLKRFGVVTEDMAGDGTTRAPSVEADGAVTNVPGLALCLIQSDCAPVYFYDPEKRAAGICHSGRKGTQLHIVAEVIKTMKEAYGTDPEDLFCVIGPHICGKCYEVGKDVAEEFAACFPEEIKKRAVLTENGHITLDLSAAIRRLPP